MNYALFGSFADRYDLHTPPHHYQHDHTFVLAVARERCPSAVDLLDVGCGTGVFLDKARDAGFSASGLDASPAMVRACGRRLGTSAVRVERMEDLNEQSERDVITSLSWTLNYVTSDASIFEVTKRVAAALRPRGVAILQVAHAPNAGGAVFVDTEPDPDDESESVTLIYRFRETGPTTIEADYVYARPYSNELASETHLLRAADVSMVARACSEAGLSNVEIFDNWKREPFARSVSPFVVATK